MFRRRPRNSSFASFRLSLHRYVIRCSCVSSFSSDNRFRLSSEVQITRSPTSLRNSVLSSRTTLQSPVCAPISIRILSRHEDKRTQISHFHIRNARLCRNSLPLRLFRILFWTEAASQSRIHHRLHCTVSETYFHAGSSGFGRAAACDCCWLTAVSPFARVILCTGDFNLRVGYSIYIYRAKYCVRRIECHNYARRGGGMLFSSSSTESIFPRRRALAGRLMVAQRRTVARWPKASQTQCQRNDTAN